MSPTQRTLAWLRERHYTAAVVEHWNPHARRRVDLFGCLDILALDGEVGVLGIQVTTTSNLAARYRKIREECAIVMREWLDCRNRLQIHGWSKKGARGTRKLWTLTVRELSLADLDGATPKAP